MSISDGRTALSCVMPGLVPGIHDLRAAAKTWMALQLGPARVAHQYVGRKPGHDEIEARYGFTPAGATTELCMPMASSARRTLPAALAPSRNSLTYASAAGLPLGTAMAM